LPEYYPTRTERTIMQRHGAEIARRLGPGRTVIEPGAGSCEKARELCEAIAASHFVALDISEEFLHQSVARLRTEMPALHVHAVAADLSAEFVLPPDVPLEKRLVYYPGSSIGNFDPPQALGLLTRMRHLLQDDGALLIGVDLRKEVAVLEAAYDDAAGVTAAFNLNVLIHLNRLIGSDFSLRDWRHRAFYNAGASRIEMHLEAVADCAVNWAGGGRAFARGERIHTENSYKVDIEGFVHQLDEAGFKRTVVWTDERRWFAVVLASP
ncbi:MAG: L-histidine N(alpha)-methyltransferase, partial [Rhizobacter sp.]|nr:L-histidine N(alpha)-methyltransferase [Rhizobacter sp.]